LLLLYALLGGSYDLVVRQEIALVIWWILGLGFALRLLPRSPARARGLLPLAVLLALAAWTAVGFAWTESAERTTAELARTVGFAGLLLLVPALVTTRTWRTVAGGLALAALGVSALAVASRLFPGPFPRDLAISGLGAHRLNYPFNYWNALGVWGAMAIAMGAAWSAHARSLAVRMLSLAAVPVAGVAVYLAYSRTSTVATALGALMVLALSRNRWVVAVHALVAGDGTAAAILVVRGAPKLAQGTGTAGAGRVLAVLLGACAICAVVAACTCLLHGDERWRLARRPAQAALTGLLIAIVALGVTVGPTLGRKAWNQFRQTPNYTTAKRRDPAARLTTLKGARHNLWASSLAEFKAHPAGTGAGTFQFWWERDARGAEVVRDAHSLYLESLAELGWPGLVLVLAFLSSALWLAFRARARLRDPADLGAAAALISAFIAFLLAAGVDWIWESTAVTALALAAIVTVAVPYTNADDERGVGGASGARGGRLLPRLARPGVVAVALLACLIQLPGLVSVSQVRRSQKAVRAGDLNRALRHVNDAIDAEPWAAIPYEQRALVEELAGRLQAASVDARRAVTREPTSWRHELLLARIEAELGRTGPALRAYARARRLHPLAALFPTSQQER
jgi:hypothetical protein